MDVPNKLVAALKSKSKKGNIQGKRGNDKWKVSGYVDSGTYAYVMKGAWNDNKCVYKVYEDMEQADVEIAVLKGLNEGKPIKGIPKFFTSFDINVGGKNKNEGERRVIVMSYINGEGLSTLIKNGVYDDEDIFKKFILNLGEILKQIHSKGYVHRDLKLSNVLVENNTEAYIIDYGLSCKIKKSGREMCGTTEFIPPEILDPNYYDFSAPYNERLRDTYGYAKIIYNVMGGVDHWEDEQMDMLETAVRHMTEYTINNHYYIGKYWNVLLHNALNPDYTKRWDLNRTMDYIRKNETYISELGTRYNQQQMFILGILSKNLVDNADPDERGKAIGKYYKEHLDEIKEEIIERYDDLYGDEDNAEYSFQTILEITYEKIPQKYKPKEK